MDTNGKVMEILKNVKAVMTGSHFVYTSGKHGSVYVRKDRLYPHTRLTSQLCEMIAKKAKDLDIDVVAGPSICGVVLSQWTAYHLSLLTGADVQSVFTEKTNDSGIFDKPQVFKRGYDRLIAGRRVLVVEDLTTTGASVKKVVDQVKIAGGEVAAVFVLVNRNPQQVNSAMMGAPFHALADFKAEAYGEEFCPLCKKGVPVNTEVGHGKEYAENKNAK